MKALEVVEKVKRAIESELEKAGVELVDVEYRREPIGMVLRLFIDCEGGVDVETCSDVSATVERVLDEADILYGSYNLEVSSPGLERRLTKPEHYRRFLGREIAMKTVAPVDGRRKFAGILISADDQGFSIDVDGETLRFEYSRVARANLVFRGF